MKTRTATKSFSSSKLWMCIALASVFTASGAQAFTDVPHTIATKLGHGLTYGKLVKQYEEAKRTYENLQRNLTKVGGLKDTGIAMTDDFKARADDYGMEANCPGAGSKSLSSLMGGLSLNLKGDIKGQQKDICQNVVLAQNAQYNEAVRMLKHMRKQDEKLKMLEAERTKATESGDPGDLNANTNALNQFMAGASRDIQYSETVVSAYDTYINALKENQALLGKQALTGNNGSETFADTVTRKFVQGATLKLSLQALSETRDR